MATVNDDRFASLRGQGFTGATSDMLLQWLQNAGATAKSVPDAWREVLDSLGFTTGQFNDDWRDYLLSIATQNNGTSLSDLNEWFWRPIGQGGNGGIIGAPVGNLPAWWAASYNDTTFEMVAQKVGTGSPTFTSDEMLLPDFEGVYRTIPANTAPWHGARISENRIGESKDFTLSFPPDAGLTVTTGIDDPFGGTDAVTLENNTGAIAYAILANNANGIPWADNIPSSQQTFSLYVRDRSTTGVVTFSPPAGGGFDISGSITNQWQRFAVTGLTSAIGRSYSAIALTNLGDSIDVCFGQQEFTPDTDIPSELVKTTGGVAGVAAYANLNGNTVLNNVVTEAVGAPLPELPSLYAAPAATNPILYSNDQFNGNWTKTRATATLDQVGITGEPNTATLLVDPAGGGTNTTFVRQDVTLANSNTHVIKAILKASGLNWTYLQAASFDTNPACYFDLQNGVVGTAANGATGGIEDLGNGWYACYLEFSSTTDLAGSVRVYPATADGDLIVDQDGTSSIIIGNVELYEATISAVRGAAPIVTEGVAVTQQEVDAVYDSLNHSDMQGAYYAEIYVDDTVAAALDGFLGTSGVNWQLDDGTTQVTRPLTTGTWQKVGIAYESSVNMALNVDASWSADTAYDGTLLAVALDLIRTKTGRGMIRNIQRWDVDYETAKSIIDDLMSS